MSWTSLEIDSLECQNAVISTLMKDFYEMPDCILAVEIIDMARVARRLIANTGATYINDKDYGTYNCSYLWHAIPELAFRLGERVFLDGERTDNDFRIREGAAFRDWIASCLQHSDFRTAAYSVVSKLTFDENPFHLISREPCNGNPIAMALDRLYPPNDDSDDYIARSIREIGRHRFGFDTVINSWTPSFQDYKWYQKLARDNEEFQQ